MKSRDSILIKELEQAKETIQKLVNEIARLDHILSIGKESNHKRELGYIDETSTSCGLKTIFVK